MHFTKLDALRGISILLVIIGHWLGLRQLYIANIGVEIFFVLSGFLITLILLKNKQSNDFSGQQNTASILKNFYIRRFLRIFPLYYLVLILCYLFLYPNNSIREHFVWDMLYMNNVYAWFYNIKLANFIHLWSLSVEEQFYLLWPWVIILIPHKWLKFFFIGTILTGILFRLIYFSSPEVFLQSYPLGDILLPACLDLFATGGLLAYFYLHEKTTIAHLDKNRTIIIIVGLLIMVTAVICNDTLLFKTFFRVGSACMTLGLIMFCLDKNKHFSDVLMSNSVLIYVGKISYGLYLMHLLIVDTPFVKLYNYYYGDDPRYAYILVARFLILIVVCTVSWYAFENPINKLKDKLAAYR